MAGGRVQPRAAHVTSRVARARRWTSVNCVAQWLETADLPLGSDQDPGDPGVTEQRLDAGAGLGVPSTQR